MFRAQAVVDSVDEAVRTPDGAMKVEDANKQGMAHEVVHPVTHVTQGHMDAAAPEETGPEKVQMVHGPCHTIVVPSYRSRHDFIFVAPSP
jgi:hypothetical protein